MTQWSEETPAFKIIAILARLRQESPAIAQGAYRTLYAEQDILVFERRHEQDVVIVAVNRGDAKTVTINTGVEFAPGGYTGLLSQTSETNQGNLLTVTPDGQATMHMDQFGALVVWSQPPHTAN
jgi:cyclomaltodextrin glucanotransferase